MTVRAPYGIVQRGCLDRVQLDNAGRKRNFCASGVVLIDMNWSPHLNPASWRDDEERHRIAIERQPVSGVGAALRANFPVAPLPADIQRLLDDLR